MKCPQCGQEVDRGSNFCDNCGAKLSVQQAFWKQKWFLWALGATVACVVTAVVLIVVLVPKKDKKSEDNNTYRHTEYFYDDYDSYYDNSYNSYEGTTSATSQEAVIEDDPYDEYYGGYDDHDREYYENLVREFEWLCEYGDQDDLARFSEQYAPLNLDYFTDDQLYRLENASNRYRERYNYNQ